nr:MAG TPA: hypothetical protein [Caudoviricetes sp.]
MAFSLSTYKNRFLLHCIFHGITIIKRSHSSEIYILVERVSTLWESKDDSIEVGHSIKKFPSILQILQAGKHSYNRA